MTPARHAIGVDIGGTKMAIAFIDSAGSILQRKVIPTQAERGFAHAVERLGESIDALIHAAGGGPVAGIGIGCAGPLDPLHGLINNPYTLTGWIGCDIVTPLATRFDVPVYLENDADAAAIGECLCGTGRGFDPVVMLTFGTGIGGGTVTNGEVVRGVKGEHPELGHVPVDSQGPDCYCGTCGCLESIASGTAIGLAGKAAGFDQARDVFAAAKNGDEAATRIVNRAIDAAAVAAWTICHTLLPERLVLGGGMMDEHFDLFGQEIRRKLSKATQFSKEAVQVVQAALGNDAGIVGAGILALRRAEQKSKGR